MTHKIPYVAAPTLMLKIFTKVKQASTPDRFTQDYLSTKLGFKGGNYQVFIPLAKKLNLLNTDGTPTDLYKKFRNPDSSGAAMAQALKIGYKELFERNEYANALDKNQFKGLIVEITGLEQNSRVVQLICQTFDVLKNLANFDAKIPLTESHDNQESKVVDKPLVGEVTHERDPDLNLSYTFNLVLPKTDDPAVFNAIFKSLKENLLKK